MCSWKRGLLVVSENCVFYDSQHNQQVAASKNLVEMHILKPHQ